MKRENRWESYSRQINREEVMEDIKTLIDQMNEEQKELVLKSFTNEKPVLWVSKCTRKL